MKIAVNPQLRFRAIQFEMKRLVPWGLVCLWLAWGAVNAGELRGQTGSSARTNPRVWGGSLEPQWSSTGEHFWYRWDVSADEQEFYVVDVRAGRRELVMNVAELREAWQTRHPQQPLPPQVRIDRLEFTDQPREMKVVCDDRTVFLWNLDQRTSRGTGEDLAPLPALFLPASPSLAGEEEAKLRVVNQTERTLEVLWVNFEGQPQTYGTVPPGGEWNSTTFYQHVWMFREPEGAPLGCYSTPRGDTQLQITEAELASVQRREGAGRENRGRRRGNRGGGRAGGPRPAARIASPDGRWTVQVRDDQLWLVPTQGAGEGSKAEANQERALTQDASPTNTFRRDASRARLVGMQFGLADFPPEEPLAFWSPDSQYLLAVQSTRVPERQVTYVESSPGDQLQPKVQTYPYAKPGDPLPISQPRLFRVADGQEIPLDRTLYPNPFELQFERWNAAGDRAYWYYNQRGHQVVRVLELELATGTWRTVVDESSPTFIHYSDGGKSVRHWLNDNELVWASERSGWNHLYRIDVGSGQVINPITQGKWNFKRWEHHDERTLWFWAVGVYPDQDPYHEHLCRVDWDGTNFQILTSGNGTHQIQWSPRKDSLIATYSRVDQPPSHELRDPHGKLICELGSAVVQGIGRSRESAERSWPEVFVAPGRDAQTPIWGIVHWPHNFDPQQKYPVIENIYAGPHDHHVPKQFGLNYGSSSRLAAQGFIVVQIDGMGTAWRSKAFHDVCYRNLKDAGFPDRIAWIKALAERYPQVDATRVGVYGGSAGGQNAMAAVLWHHDFYRAAAADCGCHDNRMDKIWWNEQWMGEVGDGAHYSANSNRDNAHLLGGALLLTVGEADRNVDPASTYQVVGNLIKADKDFTFIPIIGGGHGSGESPYGARQRLEFFQRHLGGPQPLTASATVAEQPRSPEP